jgi:hypothetical protein
MASIPEKESDPAHQNGNNFSEPIRGFHSEIVIRGEGEGTATAAILPLVILIERKDLVAVPVNTLLHKLLLSFHTRFFSEVF